MKFEEALKKLEEVVARLESGECSLEEALELYAQGVEMLKSCTVELKAAEQKVELLSQGELKPFVPEVGNERV